jgi:hypothetical protein
MVAVYFGPFGLFVHFCDALMNKVAPKSINAALFVQKRIAILCLVRNVNICVTSQLMSPMRELTLITVRAQSGLGEIFAE